MTLVLDRLEQLRLAAAERRPDRAALVGDEGDVLTYADIVSRAHQVAASLAEPRRAPRCRRAGSVSNELADLVAQLAVWLRRAVAIPVHRSSPPAPNDELDKDQALHLHFSFGSWTSLLTLATGGTVHLVPRFTVTGVTSALARPAIDRIAVAPTMLRRLLAEVDQETLDRLRAVGAPRMSIAGGDWFRTGTKVSPLEIESVYTPGIRTMPPWWRPVSRMKCSASASLSW